MNYGEINNKKNKNKFIKIFKLINERRFKKKVKKQESEAQKKEQENENYE